MYGEMWELTKQTCLSCMISIQLLNKCFPHCLSNQKTTCRYIVQFCHIGSQVGNYSLPPYTYCEYSQHQSEAFLRKSFMDTNRRVPMEILKTGNYLLVSQRISVQNSFPLMLAEYKTVVLSLLFAHSKQLIVSSKCRFLNTPRDSDSLYLVGQRGEVQSLYVKQAPSGNSDAHDQPTIL